MELTKKQAIEEHRKMWNWIANAIKNEEDLPAVVSCYDWISLIVKLKGHYLLNCKGQKYKGIRAYCFCCEYAYNAYNAYNCAYHGKYVCRYCPVIWSGSTGDCCDEYGEYTELVSLCGYSDENRRKAYILALKIANLPEREGV